MTQKDTNNYSHLPRDYLRQLLVDPTDWVNSHIDLVSNSDTPGRLLSDGGLLCRGWKSRGSEQQQLAQLQSRAVFAAVVEPLATSFSMRFSVSIVCGHAQ